MNNYHQFVVFSRNGHNRTDDNMLTAESQKTTKSLPMFYEKEEEIDSTLSSSSPKQLIFVPADNKNETRTIAEAETKKQAIRIEPRASRRRESPGNVQQQNHQSLLQPEISDARAKSLGGKSTTMGKAKIPRPANAFMLFANEWRKKLAIENPRESNKDISVRLGVLWKNMSKDAKEKYFALAREVDAEHKRKYPDYVYNPKEARLRKAMREQSRELSRQSILQTASTSNANTNANTSNGGDGRNVSGRSTNFLNHPMSCASPVPTATASLLSGNSSYNSGRIVNPWFSVSHTTSMSHMKPMLSHRVMQAHQRTFDKTKEVLRKQTECAGAFSAASAAACYPSDFTVHGAPTQPTTDPSVGGLESNDYCGIGEFFDGQKWHPYQSPATPYHSRNATMSKMTSRHGMQNVNPHSHGPSWNQFCGVPLFSMNTQNPVIRSPRHMVFFQDQHQERPCGIPEELPTSYMSNKMDISHRFQTNYSQSNYQDSGKCIEDAPRWETPMSVESTVQNNLAPQREPKEIREKEHQPKKDETKEYVEEEEAQKAPSKQPLPGFNQAFGSTEIGRFSRSEYFANMVGDSGSSPDSYLPVSVIPYPSKNSQGNNQVSRNHHHQGEEIIMPNDCYWIGPGIPISDPTSKYVTFLDLSHRMSREWIPSSQMLAHDFPTLIERPTFLFHDNCSVLASEHLPTYSEKKNSSRVNSPVHSRHLCLMDDKVSTNSIEDNSPDNNLMNVKDTDC